MGNRYYCYIWNYIDEINVNLQKDDLEIYNNYISMEKENSIVMHNPELLKEWDYGKNMWIDPHLIGPNYSTKKVWWKCEKGHTYEATPHKRNSGRNCPYCAGRKVWIGYNDLESQYLEIVKDWDYELNDNLKPTDVVCGSNKVVYWKCHKCGFQWKLSVIKNIKRKKKCKNCGV